MFVFYNRKRVNIYSKLINQFNYFREDHNNAGLSHKSVLSLCEVSDGNIWIGTDGGGINVLNPKNNTFNYIKHNLNKPKKIKKIISDIDSTTSFTKSPQKIQKKLRKKLPSPEYLLGQGLNFYNKREFKKAINCFQIVLHIDPNNVQSKNYLTKALAKLEEEGIEVKK